jgi:hypothetical protein
MGYDITIKRFDSKITENEWLNYIKEDYEFELINDFSSGLYSGQVLTTEIPSSGLWKKKVPFVYNKIKGEVQVKSPDIDVIEKMISISRKMNAIVIGEEDELYDEAFIEKEKNTPQINIEDYKNIKIRRYNPDKKWWQFWKEGIRL